MSGNNTVYLCSCFHQYIFFTLDQITISNVNRVFISDEPLEIITKHTNICNLLHVITQPPSVFPKVLFILILHNKMLLQSIDATQQKHNKTETLNCSRRNI